MTISTENFLKTIFLLQNDEQTLPSPTAVARSLDITNAAVTDMSKKLAAKGLVIYQKYKELSLTEEGEQIAVTTIRRHRLWESFLLEVLDVPLDKVHDEAESLEHHVSDYLTTKIDEYLGFPDFDPHGDPIPDSSGDFPDMSNFVFLDNIERNIAYKVTRIEHHSIDNLLKLRSLKLIPDSRVDLVEVLDEGDSLLLIVEKEKIVVPKWLAKKVWVKPLKLLSDLPFDQEAIIEDVVADKYKKRRFLDLGFIKGTKINKVMSAPSGDPCSYQIRGTTIALRNNEASQILIQYE
ncbi:MAG: iron dependent repressor, metal binding and dimerization domain protein [Bacteroidales bacterium]